jgi:hypothetical protein
MHSSEHSFSAGRDTRLPAYVMEHYFVLAAAGTYVNPNAAASQKNCTYYINNSLYLDVSKKIRYLYQNFV